MIVAARLHIANSSRYHQFEFDIDRLNIFVRGLFGFDPNVRTKNVITISSSVSRPLIKKMTDTRLAVAVLNDTSDSRGWGTENIIRIKRKKARSTEMANKITCDHRTPRNFFLASRRKTRTQKAHASTMSNTMIKFIFMT